MRNAIIMAIVAVAILVLYHAESGSAENGPAYPKVHIVSMHCSLGTCEAVFMNSGNAQTFCKNVEIFADSRMVAKLSELKDKNGQACERLGAGKYTIVEIPDYCMNADRITVKTAMENFLGDTMLQATYTSNFICR